MIQFTDKRLYMKGLGSASLREPGTLNYAYWSDKFSAGSVTPSADAGEITAGLGNALATMIPSNARVAVELTAQDFSMFGKAAALGASLSYGAPAPVCQVVTATGTSIAVDVSQGTPVAGIGQSAVVCYVGEVNAAAPMGSAGVAYTLNTTTGSVNGFTAESGKSYAVFYHVSRANAQMATITTNINGGGYVFDAEFAVYANVNLDRLSGDRAGTFYVHIPRLKLQPGGAVNGDQTANDTTVITGQALAEGEDVLSANCAACGSGAQALAYYLYVPCDTSSGIQGLALVGGVLTVPANSSHTITEFKLVMADGSMVTPDPAKMTYTLTGAPSGTSVTGTTLVSGATAGEGEITGLWTDGSDSFSCVANLSVTSAT